MSKTAPAVAAAKQGWASDLEANALGVAAVVDDVVVADPLGLILVGGLLLDGAVSVVSIAVDLQLELQPGGLQLPPSASSLCLLARLTTTVGSPKPEQAKITELSQPFHKSEGPLDRLLLRGVETLCW